MMVSPAAYESGAVVSEKWQPTYYLNPLAGLLQCYRAALHGSRWPDFMSIAISTAGVLVLFVGGIAYFRRMERYFADIA